MGEVTHTSGLAKAISTYTKLQLVVFFVKTLFILFAQDVRKGRKPKMLRSSSLVLLPCLST